MHGNNPNQNHNAPNQNQNNYNRGSKVAKTLNATITTGEYFSKKYQQNKKSYLTIGKLFIYHDGGMSLKLDAMPLQGQMINFYEIKPKPQAQNAPNQNHNAPPNQNQNNYNGGYHG